MYQFQKLLVKSAMGILLGIFSAGNISSSDQKGCFAASSNRCLRLPLQAQTTMPDKQHDHDNDGPDRSCISVTFIAIISGS